jgi:hypothetical protein
LKYTQLILIGLCWIGYWTLSGCSQSSSEAPLEADKIRAFEVNRLHFSSEEHRLRASIGYQTSLPSPHFWIEQDSLPEAKPGQYSLSSRYQLGVLSENATVRLIPGQAQDQPWQNVKTLVSSWSSFAALTHDQRAIIQPHEDISRETQYELEHRQDFVDLVANIGAFAALTQDGDILTWGNPVNGGALNRHLWPESKVIRLYSNHLAFGALTEAQDFMLWGDFLGGGDAETIQNVVQVATSRMAFAVLQDTGRIHILGDLAIKKHFNAKVRPHISDPIFVVGNDDHLSIGTAEGELWVIGRRHHQRYLLNHRLNPEQIHSLMSSRNAFALTLKDGQSWVWDQQQLRPHQQIGSTAPILMADRLYFVPTQAASQLVLAKD